MAEPKLAANPRLLAQQQKKLSGKYDSYWYSTVKGEWTKNNGWPTLEFMHNATANKMAQVGYAEFLRMQVDALHPFNVPIWAAIAGS